MLGELDELASKVESQRFNEAAPHELGYRAANDVRQALGYTRDIPVDPEAILQNLGVILDADSLTIDDIPLDAIAVWGDSVGPAVLLNTGNRSRSCHIHGRRSTCAHELCHLLLDRTGALPVGEVLGGRVPVLPEKRARAFAAEFLLPRDTAAEYVRSVPTLIEAIDQLSQDFGVSEEVAAWQVWNGPARPALREEEHAIIKSRFGVDQVQF